MRKLTNSILSGLTIAVALSGCSASPSQNEGERVLAVYDSARLDMIGNHLGEEYASCIQGQQLTKDDSYDVFLFKSVVDTKSQSVDLTGLVMMSVAKHEDYGEVEVEFGEGLVGWRFEEQPLYGFSEMMAHETIISGHEITNGVAKPIEDVVKTGESLWVVGDTGESFKYFTSSSVLLEMSEVDAGFGTIQLPLVKSNTSFGSTSKTSIRWYTTRSASDLGVFTANSVEPSEVNELLICPKSSTHNNEV